MMKLTVQFSVSIQMIASFRVPTPRFALSTAIARLSALAIISLSFFLLLPPIAFAQSRVNVRFVTDEADAVLAILGKRKANQAITDADWQSLFSSEGYVRLKKRETALGRTFTDDEFKTFVLSDSLAGRIQPLSDTLSRWKTVDVSRAAGRALAYLPNAARIQAKIYPEIKPRENSFVFDVKTDPAIFMYLDPSVTNEKLENTLAHELHHIGFGSSCPDPQAYEAMKKLPVAVQNALQWMGAFGEGFAMLAAAGAPDIHPHEVSPAEERARWDKDVANFNSDLKLVEKFFLDVLADKLNEEERTKAAREFFGVQGPWYTVGWKMAVTIEKTFGRQKLIETMCDQRMLTVTYNKAAREYNRKAKAPLALWSDELITRINGG